VQQTRADRRRAGACTLQLVADAVATKSTACACACVRQYTLTHLPGTATVACRVGSKTHGRGANSRRNSAPKWTGFSPQRLSRNTHTNARAHARTHADTHTHSRTCACARHRIRRRWCSLQVRVSARNCTLSGEVQGGRIREGRKHAFLGPPTWFVCLCCRSGERSLTRRACGGVPCKMRTRLRTECRPNTSALRRTRNGPARPYASRAHLVARPDLKG
jgi:hypothetical protein